MTRPLWAEVLLGKRSLGVAPLDPVEPPAGPHVLVFENDELGVERRVRVQVPAGGSTTVRVDLMR